MTWPLATLLSVFAIPVFSSNVPDFLLLMSLLPPTGITLSRGLVIKRSIEIEQKAKKMIGEGVLF